jgi:hypothetical protein
MASFFRWLALAIWTILVAPFLLRAWTGVLDRADVANHPVDWLMGWLASFAQVPGVSIGALIATGVVVGAWIDWFLRKFDGSRISKRKTLGIKFCDIAHDIADRQNGFHGDWPENSHDIVPRLMSAFVEANGFGVWVPVDHLYARKDGGRIISNYLRVVGTMLKDGHFEHAKRQALDVKSFLES